MPIQTPPQTVQATLERITQELTVFISDEMQRRIGEVLREGLGGSPRYLSPIQGGPRKRRSLPAGHGPSAPPPRRPTGAETKPALEVAAVRTERKSPPKESRVLDMSCRVEGCGERSRGPRLGFICDTHRALLTPEQQLRARESYKARTHPRVSPSTAPSGIESAPVEVAPPQVPAAVVVTAEPLPDPVNLSAGVGPAPAGSDYVLSIDRARLVTSQKLGPTVELKLTVARGSQLGCVARGRFPLAGRGLAVLIEAALGEPVDATDPSTLARLTGRIVLADVVSSGNPEGSLAIVRNIRPLSR
jgi:hypothetical protein